MEFLKHEKTSDNTTILHSLLAEKEKKWLTLNSLLSSSQVSVVKLSLNIPGFPKTTKLTTQVLTLCCKIIRTVLFQSIEKIIYFSSFSGDSILFFIKESPYYLKKFFYSFEKKWRIFDLDVYFLGKPINSNDIGELQKTCFLCEKPFSHCIRYPHKREDIIKFFLTKSHEFLRVFS